jgi:single-strand DNA-binding protein
MNQTTIAGHLGADPEVRFTSSGKKVTTFRVAARVRRGTEDTIWWRVSVWGEEFDKMIPHFKKGSSILVVGEMNKPEIFTDRDGKPQVSMSLNAHHLYFSPFGRTDSSSSEGGHYSQSASHHEAAHTGGHEQVAYGQAKAPAALSDDDIPF